MEKLDCDFLILGSGVAGLYAAWRAAARGQVILVTNGALTSGSSYRAQGGIAAALFDDDTVAAHVDDTLRAGRGLCDPAAVDILTREGVAAVQELLDVGMRFDVDGDGRLCRGLEGGHSCHRILHAQGAQTGKALVEFLIEKVRSHAAIQVLEHGFAYHLCRDETGRCTGAGVRRMDQDRTVTIQASFTLLATGGYAALFARSTNPAGSIGLGLGLAQEAGARLVDLEFVQFHPTAFHDPEGRSFLISEAVRGAGATLLNETGERFLAHAPGAELAPRDTVAAAIHDEIARQKQPFVGLDLRHLDPVMLARAFGCIMDAIAEHGVDAGRSPVPVSPAAHYCIGGVATDHYGATDVPGLYAAGEVAATGVHGANRLASNSLLECLVFAGRAVIHAQAHGGPRSGNPMPVKPLAMDPARADMFAARRARLGALLTQKVGIERDEAGLVFALQEIEVARSGSGWDDREDEYFAFCDFHMHRLAYRMAEAARRRKTSVGVHRRRDECVNSLAS